MPALPWVCVATVCTRQELGKREMETWRERAPSSSTSTLLRALLQKTFVVSAGNVSLISALHADTIYMILKIIISIDWLKAADTNKCPPG
jgi:hypothetical protein